MEKFFYKNWWLFYLLFFLLLGLLLHALLWKSNTNAEIASLKRQLSECQNSSDANNPNVINCDAVVTSGGKGVTRTKHVLGSQSGWVKVQYDMQNIPDQIRVLYDNENVAGTDGQVKGEGILEWEYEAKAGKPDFCIVEMSAPGEHTVWDYLLNCPI